MSTTDHTITLRKATLADLDHLKYWNQQAHVIAADPDGDWSWETELAFDPPWREQLIAELDGEAIGFVQIIDPHEEESHYWGEVPPHLRAIDIWIGPPQYLGQGYGTIMMKLALARCFADPQVTAVLIDPLATNTDAIRFYRRLGFQFVEERNFAGDHCHVYQINRLQWRSLHDVRTSHKLGE